MRCSDFDLPISGCTECCSASFFLRDRVQDPASLRAWNVVLYLAEAEAEAGDDHAQETEEVEEIEASTSHQPSAFSLLDDEEAPAEVEEKPEAVPEEEELKSVAKPSAAKEKSLDKKSKKVTTVAIKQNESGLASIRNGSALLQPLQVHP